MKTAITLCLMLTSYLANAQVNFKNFTLTNAPKASDLVLIDVDVGGGAYRTYVTHASNLLQSTVVSWERSQLTNDNGVVAIINQPRITNAILSQVIMLDGLAYNFPTAHDRAGSILIDYDNAGTLVWGGSSTNPLHDIYMTNVTINNQYVSGVNPTVGTVPFNLDGTNFGDSLLYNASAPQHGMKLDGLLHPYGIAITPSQSSLASSPITVYPSHGYTKISSDSSTAADRVFHLGDGPGSSGASDGGFTLLIVWGTGAGTLPAADANMALSGDWVPSTPNEKLSLIWDSADNKWYELWRYPLALKVNSTSGRLTMNSGGQFVDAPFSTNGTSRLNFGGSPAWYTTANNSGFGINALSAITTGTYETAVGGNAGNSLTTGRYNTLIGEAAGGDLKTEQFNTFLGTFAGMHATNVNNTVIIGSWSLSALTNGNGNVAVGDSAGITFKNGGYNVMIGEQAGGFSGNRNILVGSFAGHQLTNDDNILIGDSVMLNGINMARNIAIGTSSGDRNASSVLSNNIFIGWRAGYIGPATANLTNAIAIGYSAQATNNNDIVIGNPSNTSIYLPPNVYAGGVPLGTSTGSAFWTDNGDGTMSPTLDIAIPGTMGVGSVVVSNMTVNVVPVMDSSSPPMMVPSATTTNDVNELHNLMAGDTASALTNAIVTMSTNAAQANAANTFLPWVEKLLVGDASPTNSTYPHLLRWPLDDNGAFFDVHGNLILAELIGAASTSAVHDTNNGCSTFHLSGSGQYVQTPLARVWPNAVLSRWTKYANNPVINESTSIQYGQLCKNPTGGWYWFGCTNGVDVVRYSSSDLITWSSPVVVLAHAAGAWDSQIQVATVFQKPSGTWCMFYRGFGGTNYVYNMGFATSADGTTFTRKNNGGVNDGNISLGGNYDPVGVLLVGSRYYVYVNGSPNHGTMNMFYSDDDLATFTANAENPLFSKDGLTFCGSVFATNGFYYMLVCRDSLSSFATRIYSHGIAIYKSTTPAFTDSTTSFLGFAEINDSTYDLNYVDTPSVPFTDVYRTTYDASFGSVLYMIYDGLWGSKHAQNLAAIPWSKFLSLPTIPQPQFATNVTFSFWVNFDTVTHSDPLFSIGNGLTDASPLWLVEARTSGANLALAVYLGGAYQFTSCLLAPSTVYHIVIKRGTGNTMVYVNDQPVTLGFSQTPNTSHPYNLYLGAGYGGRYLDGHIWDFRIYSRELEVREIDDLYRNGLVN